MFGFDIFQNAGVFARLWLDPGPAFLPPEKLFQRIPLGYLTFLISASMLTWLMLRLKIAGWKQGALFGLELGGLLSVTWVLALGSVFAIRHSLLVVWFFGGMVQYISAAAVIGSGLSSDHLGRLSVVVVGLVAALVVATIVLQTLGFAPAMQYR